MRLERTEKSVSTRRNSPDSDRFSRMILGSDSIVPQLLRLTDDFQFVGNPAVLEKGKTVFEGLDDKVHLKLKRPGPSRTEMFALPWALSLIGKHVLCIFFRWSGV